MNRARPETEQLKCLATESSWSAELSSGYRPAGGPTWTVPPIFPWASNAGCLSLPGGHAHRMRPYSLPECMNSLSELPIQAGAAKAMLRVAGSGKLQPPGIEPGSKPWEGSIMPLDHGCSDLFPRSAFGVCACCTERRHVLSLPVLSKPLQALISEPGCGVPG